jgi:hypothetical protein
VHVEHGFFNYQPNFFEALSRYNSYKIYGMWVGPGWQSSSLVPWEPDILDYLVLNSKTTHLLVVLMQKQYNKEFCVPFQGVYEQTTPDDVMVRYSLVVDGELYDGRRIKYLTKQSLSELPIEALRNTPGRELLQEIAYRIKRRLRLLARL